MHQELIPYILIVSLAGILSLSLSLYALLKRKDAPGAKPFILVTLFSSLFTFSYAFELASTTLENIKFWLGLEYLFMPFIPVFILFMCQEYTGQRLKKSMYYTLFVIPIITIFMHETNDLHHLYYTSVQLSDISPFPILMVEQGPWFYVHSIFLFLCLMMSIIVLLIQLRKTKSPFRMQIILMVAGIVMPVIANYFYLNGLSPYGIDLGPVSMSVSFLFHGYALFAYQMFAVTPIARETIFESMRDGVIVINQNGRIADFNQAMVKIMPALSNQTIGKSIGTIVEEDSELAQIIWQKEEGDYDLCLDGENTYHIRCTPIKNTRGKIITFVDITERVQLQEKLKNYASFDGLTQVYNRSFFIYQTEKMIESTQGGDVSIVMFDIDHFKKVNDTYGHEAGDLVLSQIAAKVKARLRTSDIMGRYGGEEFIVCLPNTSVNEAYELAQSMRVLIMDTVIPFREKEIRVTSSFGISSVSLNGGESSEILQNLMREADQVLYIAKNKGRNQVETYHRDLVVFSHSF